jgi:nicotinamide phosphoribosyltransferase
MTDVYKLGHMRMYKPGTTKVYSYLCARSTKKESEALFFGLQPYLKLLSKGVTAADAEEFMSYYTEILGAAPPADIAEKINALVKLGHIPLEIKAVPEGTLIDNKNVLATVTNTDPRFAWVVGFFESLLLKVWNTTSVATLSHKFKRVVTEFTKETSDSDFLLPFLVHDFGYRGVSSEATAELSGAAHLVNFCGTDTIPAVKFLKENYGATGLVGASVPASEHSIHCSFGPTAEDELAYVNNMMDLNPTGIVSVVSDAYDYWRMLTVTLPAVKDRILARDGKYVVRPDSGDPMLILCGDPNAEAGSPANKGTFRLLEETFGASVNSKGYKELNSKIGVIYGDGMYFDRYKAILTKMKEMGYANTNLVIGIGGLLLQQHNRDDLGFAFKATYAEINGIATELYKDPITDPGKKSHKGLMMLVKDSNGKFTTKDGVTWDEEGRGELETVFINGVLLNETTLQEVRDRANIGL